MSIDEPKNLEEWLYRLKRYENGIFVREQVDGKWDAVALSKLPTDLWAKYVAKWLEDGVLPVRVKEDSELVRS